LPDASTCNFTSRRKAIGFPIGALVANLNARIAQPRLSKPDWVALAALSESMKQNAYLLVSG